MSVRLRVALPVSVAFLVAGVVAPLRADEPTRTFAEQKCRYTLPGPDWSWVDQQTPSVLFMANDARGYVVNLSFGRLPQPSTLNQSFVNGFEKSFYPTSKMTKRGGRLITFLGQPCYQAESSLADGRTSALRLVLAHGNAYTLGLIGSDKPVESEPDFEAVMNGLSFTEPPAPETEPIPPQQPKGISERMGEVAAVCLMAAGRSLYFAGSLARRRLANNERLSGNEHEAHGRAGPTYSPT
jgi:hypothetical protein